MHQTNEKIVLCRRGLTARQVSFSFLLFLPIFLHAAAQEEPVHVEVPVNITSFQPNAGQSVTMTFDGLTAIFEPSSPMAVRLQGDIANKTIYLPTDVVQVDGARLYGRDRLVITGMVNGDVWKVVITEIAKGSVIDEFLCYSPAISPNGRYVAFVKFYPAHGISSAEDHYMLYDVALGPNDNRPTGIHHHPAVVGRVIFPKGMGNTPGDNVDVGVGPVHRMASDRFFWNGGSTSLVFVDQVENQYSAVVVSLKDATPLTQSVQIPLSAVCAAVSGPCSERLSEVRFQTPPGGAIDLTLRGVNGTPSAESHVSLSHVESSTISLSVIK